MKANANQIVNQQLLGNVRHPCSKTQAADRERVGNIVIGPLFPRVELFCLSDGSEQFAVRVQDGGDAAVRILVSLTWNYGTVTHTRLAG